MTYIYVLMGTLNLLTHSFDTVLSTVACLATERSTAAVAASAEMLQ